MQIKRKSRNKINLEREGLFRVMGKGVKLI